MGLPVYHAQVTEDLVYKDQAEELPHLGLRSQQMPTCCMLFPLRYFDSNPARDDRI